MTTREIGHTADLGIEIETADLSGLFSEAAEALFGLVADSDDINPNEKITVSAVGQGWEELFHAWLCELLAQFNLKGFVGKHCEMVSLMPERVEGLIRGECLDLERHRFYTEIKGVTYHQFKVWQEDGMWRARVIFDV
jgi:SHS2 domain-containing protein